MRVLNLAALLLATTLASAGSLEKSIDAAFPDEIAGLKLNKRTEFPEKPLGVNLSYLRPGPLIGSIYIYNAGMASIPSGTDGQAVRTHFGQVIGEMKQWEKQGGKVFPLDGQPASASVTKYEGCGPQFIWKTYEMQLPENTLHSSTYLTGVKNHFVKLRITYPKADPTAKSDAEKFVRQVRQIVGGC